jgi:hypothetical protein
MARKWISGVWESLFIYSLVECCPSMMRMIEKLLDRPSMIRLTSVLVLGRKSPRKEKIYAKVITHH